MTLLYAWVLSGGPETAVFFFLMGYFTFGIISLRRYSATHIRHSLHSVPMVHDPVRKIRHRSGVGDDLASSSVDDGVRGSTPQGDLRDRIYRWVANHLPRRVVSHAVLRVLHEVMPKQTLEQVESGNFTHPNEIGWFEALQKFDPLPLNHIRIVRLK